MLARELMTAPAITIPETASLREAAELLLNNGINGLPVTDASGDLVGIITSTDFTPREEGIGGTRAVQVLRRWLGPGGVDKAYEDTTGILLRDVMNKHPITASEDASIEAVAKLMMHHDIHHVPIVRDRKVVGIVTRHDFLRMVTQ